MVLPVAWKVDDAPVLLIGAGNVGETRIKKLIVSKAQVTVISPDATDRIKQLAEENKLTWHQRVYSPEDLDSKPRWNMVLTAIPDRELSKEIALTCRDKHIPVNAADIPDLCDFYFGSTIVRDDLNVMISTGGAAPRMARNIRIKLEETLDQFQFGPAITKMGELRKMLRDEIPDHDPESIKLRMSFISKYCDTTPTREIASLTTDEMRGIVKGVKMMSLMDSKAEQKNQQ